MHLLRSLIIQFTSKHDCHLDSVAIAHDHSYAHNQMENELNTNRCILIADCLMIVDKLVQLDVAHEMCSKAVNKILFDSLVSSKEINLLLNDN